MCKTGKSATINAAAEESGHELLRLNLSSRTTIDDLIGKVVLRPSADGSGERPSFQPFAFTIAFRTGRWLMLDELNLAPDPVLQALELAMDTVSDSISHVD